VTLSDWWAFLAENLDDLVGLMVYAGPEPPSHKVPPGLVDAETIRRAALADLPPAPADPAARFRWAVETKDFDAAFALVNRAYWGLPESPSVRSLPGFHALCDACSEAPDPEEP
jgi:hypothetical protein